ncbi:MAG: YceH family protein [Solirubrobacteraceae bacterium]
MDLSSSEIRVLACLLEKQRTTPDHYPLSLNSLRLACNQATNREPVVDYDDAIIRDALHRLDRRSYIRLASGRSSRTAKYRHLLSEALPMSDGEQAIMCVLMLRGPQTPGELKQRSERLHAFDGLDGVHETLAVLIGRGLVAQLNRRPGQKEERYAQLLGDSSEGSNGAHFSTHTHVVGERSAPAPPTAAIPWRDQDDQDQGDPPPGQGHPQPGQGDRGQGDLRPDQEDLQERVTRLEREVAELRAVLTQP